MGCLKQQQSIISVWEAKSPKSRSQQSHALSDSTGRIALLPFLSIQHHSFPLLVSGVCRKSLAFLGFYMHHSSHMFIFPLCVFTSSSCHVCLHIIFPLCVFISSSPCVSSHHVPPVCLHIIFLLCMSSHRLPPVCLHIMFLLCMSSHHLSPVCLHIVLPLCVFIFLLCVSVSLLPLFVNTSQFGL